MSHSPNAPHPEPIAGPHFMALPVSASTTADRETAGPAGARLPVLTVICPVYNEETTIPLFFERLNKVFEQLRGRYTPQLYFVVNGSEDGSYKAIRRLAAGSTQVFALVLSRNFGYQCAVECGLRQTPGDLFVVIDVDCEDPPEMIAEFLTHYERGYDIVYGERVDRPEGALLKLCRKFFYRLIRRVADDNFVLDMAEFSLITAPVRDAILQDNNSFPFLRASIGRIGFRRKNVPYTRQTRVAGQTHYNLYRMTVFAIAGILSASTLPLRLPAYVLPFWLTALAGVALAGWLGDGKGALLALSAIGFGFCGVTLTAISIYVARIYKNGLSRPNYILVDRQCILPGTRRPLPACPAGEEDWLARTGKINAFGSTPAGLSGR